MKLPNACKQTPDTNLAWLGQDSPARAGRLLFASAPPALRSLLLRLRSVQGEKNVPLDSARLRSLSCTAGRLRRKQANYHTCTFVYQPSWVFLIVAMGKSSCR